MSKSTYYEILQLKYCSLSIVCLSIQLHLLFIHPNLFFVVCRIFQCPGCGEGVDPSIRTVSVLEYLMKKC